MGPLAAKQFSKEFDRHAPAGVGGVAGLNGDHDGNNSKVRTTYGDDALRTLGPALLIGATKSLSGDAIPPSEAILSSAILKPGHAFPLQSFLDGQKPDGTQVAFSKTIVARAASVNTTGTAGRSV